MPKKRTKKCNKCNRVLSVDLFYKNYGKPRYECKKCHKSIYDKNKSDKNRKNRYGITENEYYTLLKVQNGKCRICNVDSPKLLVDHCHKTNTVRGLLCHYCNTGIGMLKDNVEIVAEALKYLIKYSKGI